MIRYAKVPSGLESSIVVLHFGGTRWASSRTFQGAHGFGGFAMSPDGALYLLLDVSGEETRSEVWRRRPGGAGHWEQIVPESVGRDSTLSATRIMSVGARDLIFVGLLDDVGWGLYRIHLGDARGGVGVGARRE